MPSYYIYLIASLPMLQFGMKPSFSFDKFITLCADCIPALEINTLRVVSREYYNGSQPTLKKWFAFDTALRNELVKIRASRKKVDPGKYIRGDEYVNPSITHIALNAYRIPSILEAEKSLDQARWQMLEELTLGHYFDIDFLIVYALKLLILERWERIHAADRVRILEETLQKVSRE